MILSKKKFDAFIAKYKAGDYYPETLGQAFYDKFHLYEYDREDFRKLKSVDNNTAVNRILVLFDFV